MSVLSCGLFEIPTKLLIQLMLEKFGSEKFGQPALVSYLYGIG